MFIISHVQFVRRLMSAGTQFSNWMLNWNKFGGFGNCAVLKDGIVSVGWQGWTILPFTKPPKFLTLR